MSEFTSIDAVRRFLKSDLVGELERHVRVQRDEMNEATYTAITWEAIQRRVGPRFNVEIDRPIPRTTFRADIVLYRDARTGTIALEIKKNAQSAGLIADLRKLHRYIVKGKANFGAVIYFSSVEASDRVDRALRRIVDSDGPIAMRGRLEIIRVKVPRLRKAWGESDT